MRPANPGLPQSLGRGVSGISEISTGPEVAELESILTLEQLEVVNTANDRRRYPPKFSGPVDRLTALDRLMLEELSE